MSFYIIIIIITMNTQIYIHFMDDTDLHFYTTSPISIDNGTISFRWTIENIWGTERMVTIHISNIAFYRFFNKPESLDREQNIAIYYKNWLLKQIWSCSWIYPSWDFLKFDSDYDTTFIPLKNIKYYEEY